MSEPFREGRLFLHRDGLATVASGSVAQLVERTTENREVTGSTPVGATTYTLGVFCECERPAKLQSSALRKRGSERIGTTGGNSLLRSSPRLPGPYVGPRRIDGSTLTG